MKYKYWKIYPKRVEVTTSISQNDFNSYIQILIGKTKQMININWTHKQIDLMLKNETSN